MKKLGILLMLSAVFLFSACTSKVIFEERHQFANYKWNHFEPVVFNAEIKNIEKCYNIYVTLRHTTQIPYSEFPIQISITSPSGASRTFNYIMKIKTAEGGLIGNGAGDLWDLEDKVREYFFFNEKGKYKFEIMPYTQYLENVCMVDFGLKIEKANIDYTVK